MNTAMQRFKGERRLGFHIIGSPVKDGNFSEEDLQLCRTKNVRTIGQYYFTENGNVVIWEDELGKTFCLFDFALGFQDFVLIRRRGTSKAFSRKDHRVIGWITQRQIFYAFEKIRDWDNNPTLTILRGGTWKTFDKQTFCELAQ